MNEKLIKKEFLKSIKLGTGKAYLLQKKYQNIDFSKEIFKGSIKNYAIDPQCEGTRAKYMFRFIKKSKSKNKIISKILNVLENEKSDYWALEQMCDLAILFYKSGYKKSLISLNKRFEKNTLDDFEICAEEQIVKAEGLTGLLKVAEQNGRMLEEDDEYWCDNFLVDEFQKKNKSIDIYKQLKKAGRKNKYIKLYVKDLIEYKSKNQKVKKIKKFTYDIIIEKIEKGKFLVISEERANELTDSEVLRLAKEFIKTKDNKTKELYLRFFKVRRFPLDYNYIFRIAKKNNPKGTRLKHFALQSLRFYESEEIRNWVLEKIKKVKNPSSYLCLLSRNYSKGDNKILLDLINKSDNFDYIHSLINGLEEIYTYNKTKECKEPLELMYNKMNCSLHRDSLVKILYKNKVMSNNIFNELKYDSYSEIRRFYKKTNSIKIK